MKILFLSAYYPPLTRGGAERSTSLLAEALKQRGHEVTVITSDEQLRFTAKPLLEKRFSRRLARVLAKRVGDAAQYDVVHAHDFRTALALAELGWKNSLVTHRDYAAICGSTNEILGSGQPGDCCAWLNLLSNPRVGEASLLRKPARIWQYKWNLPYRRAALASFPAQVFISKAQQSVVAQRLDLATKKTAVIYNPVPTEYLMAAPIQGQLGNVLYVGRVEFYKGVGLLLAAWREIIKRCSGAQLKIVGQGAQLQEYQRLVERWGLGYSVKFEGWIPWNRLPRMYDEASVVVAPHLWVEPFGRTVAEAMARGKVVVAADVGGPAEMIEHEKTGFLFERGSRQALIWQLAAALSLPEPKRTLVGLAARDWTRQHLAPRIIAEQYEKFYQQLRPDSTPGVEEW